MKKELQLEEIICVLCGKNGDVQNFITLSKQKHEEQRYICQDCREKVNQEFLEETKNPNIIRAILLGVVGAIIGGLIWYFIAVFTGYELGYIAIGLAYLIAYGIHIGSGFKRGFPLQIIGAILTIIAIIFINFFLINYYLTEASYISLGLGEALLNLSWWEVAFIGDTENLDKGNVLFILVYIISPYLAFTYNKQKKI